MQSIVALHVHLEMEELTRESAISTLEIDSELRDRNFVAQKVREVCRGGQVAARAIVLQYKKRRPVQLEIVPGTREPVQS